MTSSDTPAAYLFRATRQGESKDNRLTISVCVRTPLEQAFKQTEIPTENGLTLITSKNIIPHKGDPYCLYVKTAEGTFRIAPWRADLGCERRMSGSWTNVTSEPDLLLISYDRSCKQLNSFLNDIPKRIQDTALQFKYMQYTALRLMRLTERSMQLAEGMPVLFWLLAFEVGMKRIEYRDVPELLGNKRRMIIQRIFGENCVFTVKFIQKIQPKTWNKITFHKLYYFLKELRCNSNVLHSRQIIPENLPQKCPNWKYIDSPFVRDLISNGKTEDEVLRIMTMIDDTIRMAEELGRQEPVKRIKSAANYEVFLKIHDKLSNELFKKREEERMKRNRLKLFPSPPLPGNDDIVPIMNAGELLAESRTMKHCVHSYDDMVFRKQCFIYKVLKPERATLCINIYKDRLSMGECSLKCNQQPSMETMRHIRQWFTLELEKQKMSCHSLWDNSV